MNVIKKIKSHIVESWQEGGLSAVFSMVWARFWMLFSGRRFIGKIATSIAVWFAPPYYGRVNLASMNRRGYISPSATIYHSDVEMGKNIFIDDRVVIYKFKNGGSVRMADQVGVFRDTIFQTGQEGNIRIGANTYIHPRCLLSAVKGSILIGRDVAIAQNCAFYSYDHGFEKGELISKQKLESKGDIIIEDDVWIGTGVIILSGVKVGEGAVIGAGSVVTKNVPAGAVAVGNPSRVVKNRDE